jgi:hypothetical protein
MEGSGGLFYTDGATHLRSELRVSYAYVLVFVFLGTL